MSHELVVEGPNYKIFRTPTGNGFILYPAEVFEESYPKSKMVAYSPKIMKAEQVKGTGFGPGDYTVLSVSSTNPTTLEWLKKIHAGEIQLKPVQRSTQEPALNPNEMLVEFTGDLDHIIRELEAGRSRLTGRQIKAVFTIQL